MLIVIGGLPGTGKTTVSRGLAKRCAATYLRIDLIEQAIRAADVLAADVGPAGYRVANALAAVNLALGRTVIADCVNPVAASRRAWRAVAVGAGIRLLEIEVICSDRVEHRRRVETRASDIPGLKPPSWTSVMRHEFEPWDRPHLILDTSRLSAADAISLVEQHTGQASRPADVQFISPPARPEAG